ncbi:MAG TPA: SUF system Fe-S cluster assembly protein [Gammaproteobacteria bacterium]
MDSAEPAPITGATLDEQIISALRTVYDPEIPVNIYDLGLIYSVEIRDATRVHVRMTLTAPACPVAGTLPGVVAEAIKRVPGVETADVELVWDPPWTPEHMSDEARLELGMM